MTFKKPLQIFLFLQNLRNSGLGCTIGGLYFGSFGYADDIILLTPSRESLQLMLDLCEKYAEEYTKSTGQIR